MVCNHIVFAVIIALHGSADVETSLRNRYLSESDLKTLISTKIASKYVQKTKKRKTNEQSNAVLRRDSRFNDLQTLTLHTKVGRQAKCRACRVDIDLGTNCFVVDGAINVSYEDESVIAQKFYFCAVSSCINAPPPPWTNLRRPLAFTTTAEISEFERNEISRLCHLVLE